MSTCLLKRMLPFLLTLAVGIGLGSLFSRGSDPRPQYTTHLYAERSYKAKDKYQPKNWTAEPTPLAILFEPATRMTEEAREHQTYGVVLLLVEYRADGHARVLERIKSLPDGLTEEAVRVAELTQFRPETVNGEPVSTTRVQSFYFHAGRF